MFNHTKLKYLMHRNSLVIEAAGECELTVTLDMREIYDFSTQGRIYEIKKEDGFIIISYTKYTDDSLKEQKYRRYLVIMTDAEIEILSSWREQFYDIDASRGSSLDTMWIYDAASLKISQNRKIVFSYSDDLASAKEEALHAFGSIDRLFGAGEHYFRSHFSMMKSRDNKTNFAHLCAKKGLDDLGVRLHSKERIYAGLPWFFQFWARDEAISLGAQIKEGKLETAKNIIFSYLSQMTENGRIPNRYPHAELESADGVGWLFKRAEDLFNHIKKQDILNSFLTKHQLKFIESKLEFSIDQQIKHYMSDGLIMSMKKETWMDTVWENDSRTGARIEIQALFLSMLRFMVQLIKHNRDNPDKYIALEKDMKKKVREKFLSGNSLKDGSEDETIRPNIFIAYYVYPELLSAEEWKNVFTDALDKLWLKWGGLSSIDTTSPLFTPEYTGENNKSYHRGDSWFWLNNLTAICLHRSDKKKFKHYINKIVNASTDDILYSGFIGQHSEISSASERKSEACPAQAWSLGMYIEMIREIYG
ncbi:MAG: hypothetical protein KKF44_08335 [Nanoarchaeota archaeon]|nr:hypothetical protein [Nanoarchaeota archaeon]